MFNLNKSLSNGTIFVGDLPLSRVLLKNDVTYPWLILVPRIENAVEIIDLSEENQQQLMTEIRLTSTIFKEIYHPDKLNVANLGNIVSQLHIHIIARVKTDPAWPDPIWGKTPAVSYDEASAAELCDKFRDKLGISS